MSKKKKAKKKAQKRAKVLLTAYKENESRLYREIEMTKWWHRDAKGNHYAKEEINELYEELYFVRESFVRQYCAEPSLSKQEKKKKKKLKKLMKQYDLFSCDERGELLWDVIDEFAVYADEY